MAASTLCSKGSTVAMIEWPIDAGTPSCLIRSTNAGGGAEAMTSVTCVAGS